MYKLSFEKCVCFIFLVILAFLSCSGFRIDRLATMSDINKRNYFTSTSLSLNSNSDFLNRLFAISGYNKSYNFNNNNNNNYKFTNLPISRYYNHKRNVRDVTSFQNFNSNMPHEEYSNRPQTRRHIRRRQGRRNRNRHFRKSQRFSSSEAAQASQIIEPHPTGRIETIVIPPKDDEITLPQVPLLPESTTAAVAIAPTSSVSRSQRSPDRNKPHRDQHQHQQHQQHQQQQRNRAYHCQRQDVARKAYLANTVVLAKAESMSTNRVHNYSVTFRILERYKTPLPIDDTLRLTFSSDTKDMNCEIIESRVRPHDLVKAQIQQSKEYFLFLNSHGMHNYSVVGMPVLRKKRNKKNKDLEDIRRVTNKNFVAKSPKKPKIKSNRMDDLKPGKKLRLMCNIKGFPVPYVSWRKDGLHPNKRTRITYKKKKTTLIINSVQVEDEGVYQCIAKGVDGTIVQDEVRVRISNRDECKDERYKENFCLNGGTCVRIMHKEIACQCPDGFTGQRCGEKDVSNHSSMYGHNTFSCKLGLSTTYYC